VLGFIIGLALSISIGVGYTVGKHQGLYYGYWEGLIDGYATGFVHGGTTGEICNGDFDTCFEMEEEKKEDANLYMHRLGIPKRLKELEEDLWF